MPKYKYKYLKVIDFDANGGPFIERKDDKATRTKAGRYVIASIGKHKSGGRWGMSTILWGTPLRENNGKMQIEENGMWKNLSSQPSFSSYQKDEIGLITDIQYEFNKYKTGLSKIRPLTASELAQELPSTWIFNDFGHLTIKYFADTNGNYRLDKKEKILSDFVHTVPQDEFMVSRGIASYVLPESHGCIHLHPKDIDSITTIYAKIGTVIQIHSYAETVMPITFEANVGRPHFELHFFPALYRKGDDVSGKMAIYSIQKRY